MPLDILNNPVFHYGLQAGFLPGSVNRLGNPGADVPVGVAARRLVPGGTLRRLFAGRLTFALTGDADEAAATVGAHDFAVIGSPTAATWAGGGDMNGVTTAIGAATNLLGFLVVARITACTDISSGGGEVSVEVRTSSDTLSSNIGIMHVPESAASPSVTNPYEGFAFFGSNQRIRVHGITDMDGTGSDRFNIGAAGFVNGAGTIDVFLLTTGS